MKKYDVAIIGCGSIGALKPDRFDYPGGEYILTHAHACHEHPRIGKILFFDEDIDKAKRATKKWSGVDTTFTYTPPHILILSIPTDAHYEYLLQESKNDYVKVVIAEKPLCSTLKEAKRIVDLYNAAKIPLLVNYTRRFDPAVKETKEKLHSGLMGEIYHVRVIYTRSIKHEGGHAIDLLNYLLPDEITRAEIQYPAEVKDYPDGKTCYARLEYGNTKVFFMPLDGREYSMFEIDILCEKGRIVFYEHGHKRALFFREQDKMYDGGYDVLNYQEPVITQTGLKRGLYNLIDNAVKVLEGKEKPLCTGEDALKVHRILDRLGA